MGKDEAPEYHKKEICLTIWERQLLILKPELSLFYRKKIGL